METSPFDFEAEQDLQSKKIDLEKEIDSLRKKCSQIESRIGNLTFKYSDPEPNFNRKQVKGFVASLLSIPEEFSEYATAIEVCAGGRLFNVLNNNFRL
jgi:structural maintenance of chromosome 2